MKTSMKQIMTICLLVMTLFVVTACVTTVPRTDDSDISHVVASKIGDYKLFEGVNGFGGSEYISSATDSDCILLPAETVVTAIFVVEGGSAFSEWKDSGLASLKDYVMTQEGQQFICSLKSRQSSVIEAINQAGLNVEILNDYTTLFNGFAASGRISELRQIALLDGVIGYSVSEVYTAPATTESEDLFLKETGIFSNNTGYNGERTIVAILDTGLNYSHSAFAKKPADVLFTENDMTSFIESTGINGIYKNAKIAYTYDYADGDTDVFPTIDHGTHVAGIIAGNDDVIKGSASEAQLAICKVFTDNGYAYTNNILDALSDMALLGVDVINMSLGSIAGFSRERTSDVTNEVYDALEYLGITLCVSAGNEYYRGLQGTYGGSLVESPDYGVIGSPGSYGAAFTVASLESQGEYYNLAGGSYIFQHTNAVNMNSRYYDFLSEILNGKTHVKLEYVVVPDGGSESAYEGLDVTGKIVLIQRGYNLSFTDKLRIAYEHGAAAGIVYNNVQGASFAMQLTEKYIPSCSVSLTLGEILCGMEDKYIEFGTDLISEPVMSLFSSSGPLSDLTLKPEITGVGGNVYSSVISGYEYMSGTSMASPNVAGVASVVRQYVKSNYPSLTNREVYALVHQLIMSTAQIREDIYGDPYSPRRQGAGLADLEKAITTKAYLSVKGSNKAKLELGDDPERSGIYTLSFNLNNLSAEKLSYNVNTIVMTESTDNGITIQMKATVLEGAKIKVYADGKLSDDGIVSVEANDSVKIKVVIELSEDNKEYIDNTFPSGMYVDGFVVLEALNGENDLSIPYLAFYGDWSAVNVFDKNFYDEEDAEIYASVPLAVYGGNYLLPLGSYQYYTEDGVTAPKASYEKIALSANGLSSIYTIYMGLLSNAKEVQYVITDDVTGDVVYSKTDYNVRKAMYSTNNGSIIPSYSTLVATLGDAPVNNRTYTVTVRATKDYYLAEAQEWSFPVFYDIMAPVLTDDGVSLKTVDGRTYLTLNVYDNHYLSNVRFYDCQGNYALDMLHTYPIPVVDFEKGQDNVLTYDITDYMDKLTEGRIVVYLEDYAMNYNAYGISVIDLYKDFDMDGDVITGYHGDGGEITIPEVSAIAENAFKGNGNITKITVSEGLKEIGANAFADMTALASIELPESLKKVGTGAFTGLNVLASIRFNGILVPEFAENVFGIPESAVIYVPVESIDAYKEALKTVKDQIREIPNVASASDFKVVDGVLTAYYGKGGTVIIPDDIGITSLGANAFCENTDIIEIVLPEGLTSVTTGSFKNCTNLESVTFPSTFATYPYDLFRGCVNLVALNMNSSTLPSTFGPPMFLWSLNITPYLRIFVPEGTLDLWKSFAVFSKCVDRVFEVGTEVSGFEIEDGVLKKYWDTNSNVVVPDEVKSISADAFGKNAKLKSITLPEGLESIAASAFLNTIKLKSIVIPESVTSIGANCFNGGALELATVYGQTSEIGANAFGANIKAIFVEAQNVDAYKSALSSYTDIIMSLGDFEITDGEITEYLGSSQSVIIPAGLNIGSGAFDGKNITYVYAASGLNTIGSNAFANITELEGEFSTGITTIGDNAFKNTKATLKFYGEVSAKLGSNVFDLSNGTIIYVEDACLADYKAEWADYASIIHATSELVVEFEIENGVLVKYNGLGGEVVIPDGVTSIAEYVFNSNGAITSVTMPEGLTAIGQYAFYNCYNLVTVKFPTTLSDMGRAAFAFSYNITTINLEDTQLTYIPQGAFENCAAIERIILPEGVTYVDNYAFSNSSACEELVLNEGLEYIGYQAFGYNGAYELNIPSTVKTIKSYGFYRMGHVEELFIPKGIDFPYDHNSALCFADMKALKKVFCEEGLKVLCSQMFSGDDLLEEIVFPSSLEYMSFHLFSSCISLKTIDLSNTKITVIHDMSFAECTNLYTVILPDSIIEIEAYAFRNCTSLTEINLPESLQIIGSTVFYGCGSLRSINFGNTEIRTIATSAFFGSALTEIVLPDSIASIGGTAFGNTPLKRVTILSESVPAVSGGAFPISSDLTIYVLSGMRESYLANSSWATYESNLVDLGTMFRMEGTKILEYLGKGGDIIIPLGITEIGEGAFADSSVTSVVLPEGLIEIGSRAFENCSKLTAITINKGIEYIGSKAFAGCGLKEITIYSDVVPSVADDAFEGCGEFTAYVSEGLSMEYKELKAFENASFSELGFVIENGILVQYIGNGGNVVIPEGVKEIGTAVFAQNNDLISVIIPEGVEKLGDSVFANCKNLVSVVMADSVKSIGKDCFNGCVNLSELDFSENITQLPMGTFENCILIKSFTFSENLRSVSRYAMKNVGIEYLVIPETVTDIADYAFYGMYSLKKLEVYADIEYLHCAFANVTDLEECYFYGNIGTIQGWDFSSSPKLRIVEFHGDVESVGLWSEDVYDIMYGESTFSMVFANCNVLERVEFFGNVGIIGGFAFNTNPMLSEVIFHGNIGGIDGFAFSCCPKLTEWTIADDNEYLVKDANGLVYSKDFKRLYRQPEGFNYEGEIRIDSTCEIIDEYALSHNDYYLLKFDLTGDGWSIGTGKNLYENTTITGIALPANLNSIGKSAFKYLVALENVTVDGAEGRNELAIGEYAFAYSTSLVNVQLPDNTVEIGNYAFRSSSVSIVNIPAAVRTMSFSLAFTECYNISNIIVSEDNRFFVMENGMLYGRNDGTLYFYLKDESVTELVIPEEIRVISANVFANNEYLVKVTLPKSIEIIGDKAFYGTKNLKTYVFEGNEPVLEFIGGGEFSYGNFYDYLENMDDVELTLYCKEGAGFDTYLWRAFFKNIVIA